MSVRMKVKKARNQTAKPTPNSKPKPQKVQMQKRLSAAELQKMVAGQKRYIDELREMNMNLTLENVRLANVIKTLHEREAQQSNVGKLLQLVQGSQ